MSGANASPTGRRHQRVTAHNSDIEATLNEESCAVTDRTYNRMDEEVRKELASRFFEEAYRKQMKGELEAAVELYGKSIESFPTAEAYTFRGWTYSHKGRLDDAIAECRKAIEVDPEFGNPYNDIGAYLLQQGRVDESI